MAVPAGITFLRDEPAVFYPRLHGGPYFNVFETNWGDFLQVSQDERGFTTSISPLAGVSLPINLNTHDDVHMMNYRIMFVSGYDDWIDEGILVNEFLFVISPEFIFYRDANSTLVIPTNVVSAWVLEQGDTGELFNHLALYNRYFTSIVAPVFLLTFVVFFISQAFIYLAAVWLFGHWQKLSFNMTIKERFAVCTFASIPAGILGFGIGIILPVFHILLFQFLMIWFSYKAMKEYINA